MKWIIAFNYAFWIILTPFFMAVGMIVTYPRKVWQTWKSLARDCAVDTMALKTGNVVNLRRKK